MEEAVDADAGPTTTSAPEKSVLEELSLSILQTVRTAQGLHGLKHGEYDRYRQYCTRRLQRLYKQLKFTHGRGRYQKKKLDAAMVTDLRWLHIPLLNAERAWAYAMDIKGQVESPTDHKRQHLKRRLAKAARWAANLGQLASQRCDARTALEAEAYASWMAGNVLFEKGTDYDAALAKFQRAKKLFEELAKVGSMAAQQAYRAQLDEMDPSLRYCEYQISRAGGTAPSADKILEQLEGEGQGFGLLESKLAALRAEQRTQSGASASSLEWRGTSYPITSEKVRESVAQALELQEQLASAMDTEEEGGLEERMGLYDKAVNAFNSAKGAIRSALATTSGDAAEAMGAELAALNVAVSGRALELSMERGLALVAHARQRFEAGLLRASVPAQRALGLDVTAAKAKGDKERAGKPEDVVRLYDTLAAYAREAGELAMQLGGSAGEAMEEEAAVKGAVWRAQRCYYVGHSYLAAGRQVEAHALFQLTVQRSAEAKAAAESQPLPEALAGELAALEAAADAWRIVAAAEAAARRAAEEDALRGGVGALALDGGPKQAAADKGPVKYLIDDPDALESFAGENGKGARIYPIPPRLRAIPVRPILIDAALNNIRMPSLAHRVKKEEPKSMVSRLFGWGKS